ncbi:DoxX family protein [Sphingosinithalassobacter sp. LHW66-3]|uniref:DoxX family protein n=1 Tax=Sphingosinithalassobacter sp. LHW66-3 TaxID=3424718 RepID=UPI003D6C388D
MDRASMQAWPAEKGGSMTLSELNARLAPAGLSRAWVDPIFRISTSLIFIIGGIGHFLAHDHMLERMAESPWRGVLSYLGDPSWMLWLSGAVFLVFGFTLALGYLTRISALLIIVTLIPVTIAVHVAPGHAGPFFKNIAIMGALLYFYVKGPGRFAFDEPGTRNYR